MENKNFKDKLKQLVDKSDLNACDKGLWSLFMAISPSEEDEAIYEAVSESDDNLKMLTEHLQGKIYSMQNINEDGWQKLVNNPEKFSLFLGGLC
ncbi:MAG: hypothetical protein US83_C0004G0017 [Candidatus Falkowbacteria bacterium GW2011_GWC2_38_22]|uniref:Uncharacterized protein n=1 Tax=Candidatus Falkowbacteria bacterium GW2011_GWE1_38_31 TaxID=1618638 RepID=A0A0G0K5B7_9BACT|nr:MAG: hypothetical protein US73_C0002G0100 [Candidatus Falkowbacteria bacterium GW2011_GWF2_38_1205]KKQ61633.1 MAG: hypothetical protein US83_C0004G0017 [Candidatus Falkowbacteria bacterium GW2011_GWC2_38_22]KKQ63752.1 MAG: hypothetical protein US84_C0004G0100 [Candidatus Falkowbacteria bacterium GW2011_GWF1_38_22]KKQ65832.1 MAG: hypothetical protein US87_C0004G0017 [Candidatus Falkowbacteria bacterium GW2011_GWE2_38_254]KKQ70615.1 MAG: hypothetical protein US91_C0004G0100 [Candidatus Falkowb